MATVPNDPQSLNAAGVRLLDAGEAAAAADMFMRALAHDSRAPALWLNLAKAQRLLGDDEGERASLDAALAIDGRHLMALIRKAQLLERTGELPAAARMWGGANAVAPPRDQRPPALADLLDHGAAIVAAQNSALADAVDTGLASVRTLYDDRARRRFERAVDLSLGRQRLYHNECAGMHFPFIPEDEFFDRSYFPWMPALEARTPAIRAEIERLLREGDEGFAPYVSMDPGAPPNKWTELDNSMRWGCYYLWKYGERVPRAHARCPETAAALADIARFDPPGRGPTAFFSLLQPHTRIPPHTGVSNTRAIVHLPLIVPEGCWFRVGGETRLWRVGEAFAFDDTIEHEAANDSAELRVVLIFDVWNPHLTDVEQALVREFYRTTDASGLNPEPRET